jgi:hypothetical protein
MGVAVKTVTNRGSSVKAGELGAVGVSLSPV